MARSVEGDFDIEALYHALDSQRIERGLSWLSAAREINRLVDDAPNRPHARPMSTSTISGIRDKRFLEGDGVLQMLVWLNRTPESFVRGCELEGALLPRVDAGKVLRWDTQALFRAVETKCRVRGLTWQEAADEVGCGANSLSGLAKRTRVGFPGIMRLICWLGRPAAEFTRVSDR